MYVPYVAASSLSVCLKACVMLALEVSAAVASDCATVVGETFIAKSVPPETTNSDKTTAPIF